MKVEVLSKQIDISSSMQDAIDQMVEEVNSYFKLQPISMRLEIKQRNEQIKIEAMLFFKNNHFIRQEVMGQDFYQAINTLTTRLKKQVRKLKAKLNDKNRYEGYEVFASKIESLVHNEDIRYKTLSLKPMDEEEAKLQLEVLGQDFYIFKNLDDVICVLYKRHSGYGLIRCE